MKRRFRLISLSEFMKATRSPRNCWMFKTMDAQKSRFYLVDNIYYFENGKGIIRRFKEVRGKIMFNMKKLEQKQWSGLWYEWNSNEW